MGRAVFLAPTHQGIPYEYRKGTPVFAMGNGDGSSSLLTADQIRTNWNAWANEYFTYPNGEKHDRLTPEQAEAMGLEVL
jgi:hypothetical protein